MPLWEIKSKATDTYPFPEVWAGHVTVAGDLGQKQEGGGTSSWGVLKGPQQHLLCCVPSTLFGAGMAK